MNSSNPAIKKLKKCGSAEGFGAVNPATYGGIGLKVLYYLAITVVSAVLFVAFLPTLVSANSVIAPVLLVAFMIVGVVSSFIAAARPKATPVAGTVYCIVEGALVGIISSLFEVVVQGVIIMALLATMLTLAVVALLYFTGVVRVGSRFRRFVICSLFALVVSQLVFLLLSVFVPSVQYVFYNNFALQLIVSLIFIVIAALSMFTDFDNITNIVEGGLDKTYEWMAAYSLMVTLIWLYMEFLRLALIIFANRD